MTEEIYDDQEMCSADEDDAAIYLCLISSKLDNQRLEFNIDQEVVLHTHHAGPSWSTTYETWISLISQIIQQESAQRPLEKTPTAGFLGSSMGKRKWLCWRQLSTIKRLTKDSDINNSSNYSPNYTFEFLPLFLQRFLTFLHTGVVVQSKRFCVFMRMDSTENEACNHSAEGTICPLKGSHLNPFSVILLRALQASSQ